MIFEKIGLMAPRIAVPNENIDLTRWAVIACDQYTSQPEYWQETARITRGVPSTLDLIFPEVYLEDDGEEERIAAINSAMDRYFAEGVLKELPAGFMLVDRRTSVVPSRKGLVVALDLEAYDYNKGATSLIRATEGTILDRLPPRIRVRKDAALELPHIMVLIDDPCRTVIEPLFEKVDTPLYDFDLMQNGGHLTGYHIADPESINQVAEALARLAEPAHFAARYDVEEEAPLLFAMGDGNHSFATAKAIWEGLKEEAGGMEAVKDHPARFALVELVNIHDPGLEFEGIHRVAFDIDHRELTAELANWAEGEGASASVHACGSREELQTATAAHAGAGRHLLPYICADGYGLAVIENPPFHLEVGTLQTFLDLYLERHGAGRVDYIHGEDAVTELGGKPGNIGFYLPAISKDDFFKTIIVDGAFPRKTFSMGESDEKRFYLECRRIK